MSVPVKLRRTQPEQMSSRLTEGEHVLGDMVTRARVLGIETPVLDLAHSHVAAYESGRAREARCSGCAAAFTANAYFSNRDTSAEGGSSQLLVAFTPANLASTQASTSVLATSNTPSGLASE